MNMQTGSRSVERRGLWLILCAALLWGTVGVATKGIYELSETNALSIGFFRLAIATPALLLACWRALGRGAFRIAWRDRALMIGIGAAMAFYQVCYFAAIARVGVAVAVLVTLCTAPVLIAMMAAVFLRERLTSTVLLALICALAGTIMLVWVQPGEAGTRRETILGVLLALASALGYAVIALVSRTLAGRYHPLQPITVGFAAGTLLLLPFALWTGLVLVYPLKSWLLLLHLGLLPTALAYVLFLAGIRHTSATVASVVTLIEPLTSTALAWLFFDEQLGPLGLLGAALLLGAIGLLYRGATRPAEQVASGQAQLDIVQ